MLFGLIKFIVRIATLIFSIGLLLSYTSAFIPPKSLWFFQLFGLAYPAILLATIVLMILNFLFSKKFIFPLLVILIGTTTHMKYFGISFDSEPRQTEHGQEIKVMSFNVRLFDAYKNLKPELNNGKEAFGKVFNSEMPDILCLQEYAEDETNSRLISMDDILRQGNYVDHTTTMILELKNMFSGQAIFSRYPIIHSEIINDSSQTIRSLFADIVIEKDTVRVYNCHLESIRFQQDEYSLFDMEVASQKSYTERIKGLVSKLKNAYPLRLRQAQKIIEHANQSPYPVFICGDFNEPPTSYVYSMLEEHYKDAFYKGSIHMARTYAGKVPAGRIDYIFHSKEMTPIQFNTYMEEVLSDHYPISASFKLK